MTELWTLNKLDCRYLQKDPLEHFDKPSQGHEYTYNLKVTRHPGHFFILLPLRDWCEQFMRKHR